MEAKANSRPGSLLEHLVADVFIEAGFEVQQNKYLMGHEIDVLAELGDTKIIIECKQYESSYLSVKNLIYTWHGKNQDILADKILFVIYGVNIKEEEYKLAEDYGISIWNIDVINTIKSLVGIMHPIN